MACRELAGALLCVLIAVDGLAPGAVVDGWNPHASSSHGHTMFVKQIEKSEEEGEAGFE